MKKLKYVGPGFVPGVPAQDITVSDEEAEELVKGGAYEYVSEPKPKDKDD